MMTILVITHTVTAVLVIKLQQKIDTKGRLQRRTGGAILRVKKSPMRNVIIASRWSSRSRLRAHKYNMRDSSKKYHFVVNEYLTYFE